jgi:hypothetical protein
MIDFDVVTGPNPSEPTEKEKAERKNGRPGKRIEAPLAAPDARSEQDRMERPPPQHR